MLSLWLSRQLSCRSIDARVRCYHSVYPGSYRAIALAIQVAILLIHPCWDLLSLSAILAAIVLSLWLSGQLSCYLFGYPGSYPADQFMLGSHAPGSYRAIAPAIQGAICCRPIMRYIHAGISCSPTEPSALGSDSRSATRSDSHLDIRSDSHCDSTTF